MQLTAAQLAQLLGGTVDGNPDAVVSGVGKIESATPEELTFLSNPKYEPQLYASRAGVVLVSHDFQPKETLSPTLVRVGNVYAALAALLEQYQQQRKPHPGRSDWCKIDESARIGDDAYLGDFTVIGKNVQIGHGAIIHSQVYIGENVRIGDRVELHPGVRIYAHCVLGDDCIVHANTVIGADGFGFAPQADGTYRKFPQVGNVIIGDRVEIGSNSTIDRGSMGPTHIGNGTKIDNLVMIAHNVEIGENTVIAAQAGIAGSTHIGNRVQIGGQAGFVGHIKVADGTKVQAQSGINRSVRQENTALYGSPAFGYRDFLKSYAIFRKLPEIVAELQKED